MAAKKFWNSDISSCRVFMIINHMHYSLNSLYVVQGLVSYAPFICFTVVTLKEPVFQGGQGVFQDKSDKLISGNLAVCQFS